MAKGNNGLLGHKRKQETIEKIRLANIGKKRSEEAKFNMSLSHRGLKLSEEHKKKISIGNKGKRHKDYIGDKPICGCGVRLSTHLSKFCNKCYNKNRSGTNHWRWIEDRKLLKDDHRDRGGQLIENGVRVLRIEMVGNVK